MVENNEIGRLKTGTIKDAGIRLAAEQYVRKLVLIMPVDTAKRNETDSLLWDQVWEQQSEENERYLKLMAE